VQESAFYATEAICVLQWGRASDRIGRKPVLLGGLLGITMSMIGFGLSKQFWSIVLARCAEGALCGNIGVAKGMVAELTDSTNMAQGTTLNKKVRHSFNSRQLLHFFQWCGLRVLL
jgi:MFS family permease